MTSWLDRIVNDRSLAIALATIAEHAQANQFNVDEEGVEALLKLLGLGQIDDQTTLKLLHRLVENALDHKKGERLALVMLQYLSQDGDLGQSLPPDVARHTNQAGDHLLATIRLRRQ